MKNILFKELSSNIMVIQNPNWLIEILWYETDYIKKKTLAPLNVLPEVDCIADFTLNY
jgi:hypothetical protein